MPRARTDQTPETNADRQHARHTQALPATNGPRPDLRRVPFSEQAAAGEVTCRRPVSWRYVSNEQTGTCALDGTPFPLTLTLHKDGCSRVPDASLVEAWLAGLLREGHTTAEWVALAAAQKWGMDATVTAGPTQSHGVITVTAQPPR